MSSKMITLDDENTRFQLRVAGIATNNGRVLIQRKESDDFWALPGGRIEFLESSQNTLMREMKEELGLDVKLDQLLFSCEYFYENEEMAFHELGFYYRMSFPGKCYLFGGKEEFTGDEHGEKVIFKWYPINKLDDLVMYPSFLKRTLQSESPVIGHIIEKEY
ncbi:MAG TPA: NUDIX hydrolase [Clostridia bacterium]